MVKAKYINVQTTLRNREKRPGGTVEHAGRRRISRTYGTV
jgi:hypothetical protein